MPKAEKPPARAATPKVEPEKEEPKEGAEAVKSTVDLVATKQELNTETKEAVEAEQSPAPAATPKVEPEEEEPEEGAEDSKDHPADFQTPGLIPHRGFNLIKGFHNPDEVDQIQSLEIRDSDIFAITYPKSGTIWMQQILRLLETKGDVAATADELNFSSVPWIELIGGGQGFASAESPRLRVSHLPYKFMPLALKQKKGKVIYVSRNPKDVLVSYFHFHKLTAILETPTDFNDFLERFMKGNVFASCWFEHIKTWHSHKDDMNIIFITYEEMIQDLRSVVERIALFLGKELSDDQLASVVKHSTFANMKHIPQANYEHAPDLLNPNHGKFMRKGTIGDWKNHFTVAQSERFDQVFQREMKDLSLNFTWDINDISAPPPISLSPAVPEQ